MGTGFVPSSKNAESEMHHELDTPEASESEETLEEDDAKPRLEPRLSYLVKDEVVTAGQVIVAKATGPLIE